MSNKAPAFPRPSRPLRSLRAITAALVSLEMGARVAIRFKPIDDEVWRFYSPDDDAGTGPFVVEDARETGISSAMLGVIIAGRELEMNLCDDADAGDGDFMYRFDNDVVHNGRVWIQPKHVATLRVLPSPVHVKIDGMENDLMLKPDGSACIGGDNITSAGLRRMHAAISEHLGLTAKPTPTPKAKR